MCARQAYDRRHYYIQTGHEGSQIKWWVIDKNEVDTSKQGDENEEVDTTRQGHTTRTRRRHDTSGHVHEELI